MRKKICFIVTDAVSFNVLCKGQLEYIAQALGADITLVCGGRGEDVEKLKARDVGDLAFVPFCRKPSLFKDLYCLWLLLLFFCRNRFDLVVYSTPKALLLGSLASFITLQRRRVALVRGRAYENFTGKKRRLFVALDKLSLLISQKIIFISPSLRNVYLKEGITSSDKSLVIAKGSSNGVDVNRFRPVEVRREAFRIVTVGRICVDKGVKELREIIRNVKSRNPAVEFELVGEIEDSTASDVVGELLRLEGVVYLSSNPHVEQVFQRADLHLFLSHREGFGNVALEAAACGIPTFSFDVVGVRDSVAHGVSGMRFARGDIFEIANEIVRAAESREQFSRRYSGARKWAVENFSQNAVWESYAVFYRQLLLN